MCVQLTMLCVCFLFLIFYATLYTYIISLNIHVIETEFYYGITCLMSL